MTETPKRLAPSRETLRELYLKTGNRCAFPGCKKSLFNARGLFVGQLCHIEAAEPGGERFNKNQTNENRRHVSNLLLMCYEHHVETDEVTKFPVDRMKRIKEEHEKRFSDVVGAMLLTVTDHTTLTNHVPAKNLTKLSAALKWNLGSEELTECVAQLERLAENLANIPMPSRELFLVLVNRGKDGRFGTDLEVSGAEVQQATGLSTRELRECLSILDSRGLTQDNDRNEFGVQMIGIPKLKSGWPVWSELRTFSKTVGINISQVILNLDFSVLDE